MLVTYFALKRLQIGDDWREPGELVPEAREWKYLRLNLQNCDLAPVLVATLPRAVQTELQKWEEAQEAQGQAPTEIEVEEVEV